MGTTIFHGQDMVPGITQAMVNVEAALIWGDTEYNKSFLRDVNIDSTAIDEGNDPTTNLRPGLLLGIVTATNKAKQWDPTAGDGTEDIAGVLAWDLGLRNMAGTPTERFSRMLVGGLWKSDGLIIPGAGSTPGIAGKPMEHVVRNNLSGMAVLDDPFHRWNGNPLLGWRGPVRSLNKNLTPADSGKLFVQDPTASGVVTFTLPALADGTGFRAGFYSTGGAASHDMVVSSTGGENIIAFNNKTANTITVAEAGTLVEIISLSDGTTWLAIIYLASATAVVTPAPP